MSGDPPEGWSEEYERGFESEEGDPDAQDLCNYCLAGTHCDGTVSWCNCTCGWGDDERDDDADEPDCCWDDDAPRTLTRTVQQQGLVPCRTDNYYDWYRPEIARITATTDEGEPVL
jgi:hypothetical protein